MRLRPDLIVSFLTRANVSATVAARLIGAPVVLSERNDTRAQLAHGRVPAIANWLVHATYPRAERVIAVSDGIRSALNSEYGVRRDRVEVITNTVALDDLHAAAAEEPSIPVGADDIVMLARLEPQKHLDAAIRAFHASRCRGRLVILGEGPLRSLLCALVDALGLGDRVVMPGYVANPHAVLARARLFMLASRHEGFCNSLLEAMALGLPVIATDCRFSPAEILEVHAPPGQGQVAFGSGGLLVPVDDEPALTRGLKLLEDRQLSRKLGDAARRRAGDFSGTRQLERYWDVFDDVLKKAPDAGRAPSGACRLFGC